MRQKAALKQTIEQERTHRQELEQKLDEHELQPFRAQLTEHQQTISRLREEIVVARREAHDERGRSNALERSAAEARSVLEQERRRADALEREAVMKAELQERFQEQQKTVERLEEQLRVGRQEARGLAEHHEKELREHARSQLALCQERDERQKELSDLQASLAKMQQQMREVELAKDQLARSLSSTADMSQRVEELQRELRHTQEDVREQRSARDQLGKDFDRTIGEFKEVTLRTEGRAADLEATLEDRNNEIKLLMYRVQELSSKYVPVRGDAIDVVLAKWVNGYRPAVPFFRLGQGLYLFGRRQVSCKIVNDKPVFRVGGGFIGFDKFLEQYASEELERLLNYEIDERTGEPKFSEAQRIRHYIDEAGASDDFRNAGNAGCGDARSRDASLNDRVPSDDRLRRGCGQQLPRSSSRHLLPQPV